MTKKEFIWLADMIKSARGHVANGTLDDGTVDYFTGYLYGALTQRYPAFNAERWIGYIRGECGPNGGKLDNAA